MHTRELCSTVSKRGQLFWLINTVGRVVCVFSAAYSWCCISSSCNQNGYVSLLSQSYNTHINGVSASNLV